MALTSFEQRYLSNFPDIDPAEIGGIVGSGAEHRVHRYNGGQVLKIPRPLARPYLSPPGVVARDAELMMKHFPEHSLPTSVHRDRKDERYVVVQDRERLSNLTPKAQPELRQQLEDIVRRNREMIRRYGISLDFLGWDGLKECLIAAVNSSRSPAISNLCVAGREERRIIMPDTSMISLSESAARNSGVIRTKLFRVTFLVNQMVMRRCFGMEIK